MNLHGKLCSNAPQNTSQQTQKQQLNHKQHSEHKSRKMELPPQKLLQTHTNPTETTKKHLPAAKSALSDTEQHRIAGNNRKLQKTPKNNKKVPN